MEKDIYFVLPSLCAGGAERVVSILSNTLAERGNNVSVIVFNSMEKAYKLSEKVNFVRVGKGLKANRYLNKIKILWDLFFLLKKVNVPVVIPFHDTCLKYVMFIKKVLNIKVVACERNDPYHMYETKAKADEAKSIYGEADFCVFQTRQAREYFDNIVQERCSIIPNPVTNPEIRWSGDISKRRIITACRLTKQKNLHMAIDAISIVKDRIGINFSFDIFGKGEMSYELKDYAKKKNLCEIVHFCGVTNNVTGEMAESSIFILSSDYEGISNSMLEALSIGMPVICTDCPIGGAREMIVDSESGILIPVGDSIALADSICKLFENHDIARELGKNASKICDKYSIEKIADKWEEIIV